MYVGCCDALSDLGDNFQWTSSLMQDSLCRSSDSKTLVHVEYISYSLFADTIVPAHVKPVRELLRNLGLSKKYGIFRVACVTEGPLANLLGVGVGRDTDINIDLEKAAMLALAVAASAHRPDREDWLSTQAIRIVDHLTNARNQRAPVKQEVDDEDDEQEVVDDPLCWRPPDPWELIYDYEYQRHYYWHPETHKSSWKPPPGSQPVTSPKSVQGSHASR